METTQRSIWRIIVRHVLGLVVCGAWLAAIALGISGGCGPSAMPPSPPPAVEVSASDSGDSIEMSSVPFDTPELKTRFEKFDAAAKEVAAGKEWKHRPYERGGNFVTAVWAHGAGYDDQCRQGNEPDDQIETRKIEVDTIVVADKAKSAALAVEQVAASPDEWSLLCHYREATDQGVTGAGWGMTFFKWDPDKKESYVPFHPWEQTTTQIHLGNRYSYDVRDTQVMWQSELPLAEDFVQHARSAESMRDAFLASSEKLARQVEETIVSHQAIKLVPFPSKGGPPPPPKKQALTPDEEAAELAKAKQYFAGRQQLMKEHYQELYSALRKAFPFEKCFEELTPKESSADPK